MACGKSDGRLLACEDFLIPLQSVCVFRLCFARKTKILL